MIAISFRMMRWHHWKRLLGTVGKAMTWSCKDSTAIFQSQQRQGQSLLLTRWHDVWEPKRVQHCPPLYPSIRQSCSSAALPQAYLTCSLPARRRGTSLSSTSRLWLSSLPLLPPAHFSSVSVTQFSSHNQRLQLFGHVSSQLSYH